MPQNQFNTPLAFAQQVLSEVFEYSFTSTGYNLIQIPFTANEDFIYNMSFNTTAEGGTNNIYPINNGYYKLDAVFTFKGASQNDLGIKAYIPDIGFLAPVLWNGRGGNSWAISYSQIYKVKRSGEASEIQWYVRNEQEEDPSALEIVGAIVTVNRIY